MTKILSVEAGMAEGMFNRDSGDSDDEDQKENLWKESEEFHQLNLHSQT